MNHFNVRGFDIAIINGIEQKVEIRVISRGGFKSPQTWIIIYKNRIISRYERKKRNWIIPWSTFRSMERLIIVHKEYYEMKKRLNK